MLQQMFQSDITPHRITKSIGDIRTSLFYQLRLQRKHLYQDFLKSEPCHFLTSNGGGGVMQIDWPGQWYSTRRADSR